MTKPVRFLKRRHLKKTYQKQSWETTAQMGKHF